MNRNWEEAEEKWLSGKIGSRECLEEQLKGVRVTEEELVRFVKTIPIDPAFKKLLGILHQAQIPSMIVSDSFTFIIRAVLKHHEIAYEPVFANELRFKGDRLIPSFPFPSLDCLRCAHCKKTHVLENSDKMGIYVGDGLSDVCPALVADLVFAKGGLADYLKAAKKPHKVFHALEELCVFFETAGSLR